MASRSFSYTVAVLGLPVTVQAASWPNARRKLLRLWLGSVHSERDTDLPVLPTLRLIASSDPKAIDSALTS